MKATGIVRKVDELGRIVIPKELRRTLDINEKDALEIYTEDEPQVTGCIFCGSSKNTVKWQGKEVCKVCIKALNK